MFTLMNEISELVYISDPETYELLYINSRGLASFGLDQAEGHLCYKALQGRDAPCPFCTNDKLHADTTYTWEHHNPITGCSYLLKDRLIDWNGRPARMEVAFDITAQAQEREALSNALKAEQLMMHCIEKLHQATDLAQGIYNMLSQLGTELLADRAYLFEVRAGTTAHTFEWCGPGVDQQIDRLQNLDLDLLDRWKSSFLRGDCVIIESLDMVREFSPDVYASLFMQDIHSMVAVPLEINGVLTGFVGVDNPSVEMIRNIAPLLSTLRYFLMTTMRRLEDEQKLHDLSFRDILTGLYNRNRYLIDLDVLAGVPGPVGVVYMDLNGLKALNDEAGHSAGDMALVKCAEGLRAAFPLGDCYRIGGDEFVVLLRDVTREDFDTGVSALRARFSLHAQYHSAIGASWSDRATSLDQLVKVADAEMYKDKRRYYRRRRRSGHYYGQGEATSDLPASSPLLREYHLLMGALQVSVSKHLLRDDFLLVWANDFFYDKTGYSQEEFNTLFHGSCKAYFSASLPEFQQMRSTIMDAFHSGKPGYEAVIHLPVKGGRRTWVKLVGTFTDETIDGVPVIYAVFTDVNDLVQIQREQSVVYDGLPGVVVKLLVTPEGPRFFYATHQFTEHFGPLDEDGSNPLLMENIQLNREVLQLYMPAMRAGDPVSFEAEAINLYGAHTHFRVCGGCVDWYGPNPIYLCICIDITELVEQREKLRTLAFTDPVTGGYNRHRFELDAAAALLSAPPGTYAIVSFDIQKFKVINDLFDIQSGDTVLRHVYSTIQAHLMEGELIARISADTFSLLLFGASKAAMEARLAFFIEAVNGPNLFLGQKYHLNLTFGVYPVANTSLPMIRLQDRANMARKQCKTAAHLQTCICRFYSQADQVRLAQEADMESRMQDALGNGEFIIYLQAKQDLITGAVAGAEALVRWQDPIRGLIPPDAFIPLFEQNGFIVDLDLFVFGQVCALLSRWRQEGYDIIPVSVNLSRVHLANPAFLGRYEEIRQRWDIPPHWLEFEVTETLALENPTLLTAIIDDLHRLGYRCSMDDFGSGYSSLNTLKDIRVDILKLDKAFFSSALLDDPWEAAIISGVVDLARRLQMNTVAEGVETPQQAEFLRTAGCDMIQGFLFARPLPPSQFEALAFHTPSPAGASDGPLYDGHRDAFLPQ